MSGKTGMWFMDSCNNAIGLVYTLIKPSSI